MKNETDELEDMPLREMITIMVLVTLFGWFCLWIIGLIKLVN
jgi:hypothetical protein